VAREERAPSGKYMSTPPRNQKKLWIESLKKENSVREKGAQVGGVILGSKHISTLTWDSFEQESRLLEFGTSSGCKGESLPEQGKQNSSYCEAKCIVGTENFLRL